MTPLQSKQQQQTLVHVIVLRYWKKCWVLAAQNNYKGLEARVTCTDKTQKECVSRFDSRKLVNIILFSCIKQTMLRWNTWQEAVLKLKWTVAAMFLSNKHEVLQCCDIQLVLFVVAVFEDTVEMFLPRAM